MDGHTFRPKTLLPTTPGVSFRHHILHVQNSTDPVTSMDTTTTTTTKQEPKETTNSLGIPAAQFVVSNSVMSLCSKVLLTIFFCRRMWTSI